jgi:hypothetical protein
MADRPGLLPILTLTLSLILPPLIAPASAEEAPVATAPIPPPPVVVSPNPPKKAPKPAAARHEPAKAAAHKPKKSEHAAKPKPKETKIAAAHRAAKRSKPAKRTHLARTYVPPERSLRPQYYYRREMVQVPRPDGPPPPWFGGGMGPPPYSYPPPGMGPARGPW